uniref:Phospholipase B1, membrane-associated n=1 Tax=Timema genevievae TaxID=629358 RepID=A0A7R9K3Y3_TIMGE|nr:unnamed protein product [Timema genevievae]
MKAWECFNIVTKKERDSVNEGIKYILIGNFILGLLIVVCPDWELHSDAVHCGMHGLGASFWVCSLWYALIGNFIMGLLIVVLLHLRNTSTMIGNILVTCLVIVVFMIVLALQLDAQTSSPTILRTYTKRTNSNPYPLGNPSQARMRYRLANSSKIIGTSPRSVQIAMESYPYRSEGQNTSEEFTDHETNNNYQNSLLESGQNSTFRGGTRPPQGTQYRKLHDSGKIYHSSYKNTSGLIQPTFKTNHYFGESSQLKSSTVNATRTDQTLPKYTRKLTGSPVRNYSRDVTERATSVPVNGVTPRGDTTRKYTRRTPKSRTPPPDKRDNWTPTSPLPKNRVVTNPKPPRKIYKNLRATSSRPPRLSTQTVSRLSSLTVTPTSTVSSSSALSELPQTSYKLNTKHVFSQTYTSTETAFTQEQHSESVPSTADIKDVNKYNNGLRKFSSNNDSTSLKPEPFIDPSTPTLWENTSLKMLAVGSKHPNLPTEFTTELALNDTKVTASNEIIKPKPRNSKVAELLKGSSTTFYDLPTTEVRNQIHYTLTTETSPVKSVKISSTNEEKHINTQLSLESTTEGVRSPINMNFRENSLKYNLRKNSTLARGSKVTYNLTKLIALEEVTRVKIIPTPTQEVDNKTPPTIIRSLIDTTRRQIRKLEDSTFTTQDIFQQSRVDIKKPPKIEILDKHVISSPTELSSELKEAMNHEERNNFKNQNGTFHESITGAIINLSRNTTPGKIYKFSTPDNLSPKLSTNSSPLQLKSSTPEIPSLFKTEITNWSSLTTEPMGSQRRITSRQDVNISRSTINSVSTTSSIGVTTELKTDSLDEIDQLSYLSGDVSKLVSEVALNAKGNIGKFSEINKNPRDSFQYSTLPSEIATSKTQYHQNKKSDLRVDLHGEETHKAFATTEKISFSLERENFSPRNSITYKDSVENMKGLREPQAQVTEQTINLPKNREPINDRRWTSTRNEEKVYVRPTQNVTNNKTELSPITSHITPARTESGPVVNFIPPTNINPPESPNSDDILKVMINTTGKYETTTEYPTTSKYYKINDSPERISLNMHIPSSNNSRQILVVADMPLNENFMSHKLIHLQYHSSTVKPVHGSTTNISEKILLEIPSVIPGVASEFKHSTIRPPLNSTQESRYAMESVTETKTYNKQTLTSSIESPIHSRKNTPVPLIQRNVKTEENVGETEKALESKINEFVFRNNSRENKSIIPEIRSSTTKVFIIKTDDNYKSKYSRSNKTSERGRRGWTTTPTALKSSNPIKNESFQTKTIQSSVISKAQSPKIQPSNQKRSLSRLPNESDDNSFLRWFSSASDITKVTKTTREVNRVDPIASPKKDDDDKEEEQPSRFRRVIAAMQSVGGALLEVPKQIWLLPIRFGLYPSIKRSQEEIPALVPFPCQLGPPSRPVPSSVHRLKPQDIRVVAALGDSVTSANGALATNEDETRFNYRGISAMGGGQGHWRKYMTLPNILKEYNPKLLGYALGTAETSSPLSGLNVAENGALDDELLKQAKSLVRKIRQDNFIDIDNDWKLVNILIGGNDICNEYCFVDGAKDTPSGHRKNLEVALDYLQTHLPRTFVNLIHIPNVILLRNMKNVPFVCYMKQLVLCSCLFGAGERAKAESVSKILQEYWQVEKIVSELEKYDTDTFTVVLQPFFLGVEAPRSIPTLFGEAPDLSYFAPDCFHFSQKGNSLVADSVSTASPSVTATHGQTVDCTPGVIQRADSRTLPPNKKSYPRQVRSIKFVQFALLTRLSIGIQILAERTEVANSLWNNMLEPVTNKSFGWEPLMKRFRCPTTEAPYFFTNRNSKTFLKTGSQETESRGSDSGIRDITTFIRGSLGNKTLIL